jgi:hypothetical protein
MAISGVNVPVIDLTITLPKTRTDNTALADSDIESVTVLRNSTELQTIPTPKGATVHLSDSAPSTGTDTYSFYVTDTAGVRSAVSPVASVSVSAQPPKAPPASGSLTATPKGKAEPAKTAEPVKPAAPFSPAPTVNTVESVKAPHVPIAACGPVPGAACGPVK